MPALLGETQTGRNHLVEQSKVLSLIKGDWKYIQPGKGPKINRNVNLETGLDPQPQLYDLKKDLGEKNNVAAENPKIVKELAAQLEKIKTANRSRP